KWTYYTAQNGSVEEYVCWIDDITFPGNSLILNVENVVAESEVAVYPNPAHDKLFVNAENVQRIDIYGVTGQMVMSTTDTEINVSDLEPGMYFVRVNCGDNVYTEHVIIR
ncbi:MAG: T9SS type A sorting domain-containing protein, partial [Bacteroidales bacterium]|nr:T9SS type A sorting domain-containing protein [Bacteroidales bacterium]